MKGEVLLTFVPLEIAQLAPVHVLTVWCRGLRAALARDGRACAPAPSGPRERAFGPICCLLVAAEPLRVASWLLWEDSKGGGVTVEVCCLQAFPRDLNAGTIFTASWPSLERLVKLCCGLYRFLSNQRTMQSRMYEKENGRERPRNLS